MEHVTQELLHLGVADDLSEEGLLYLVRVADPEVGQKHQESSEPGDVARRAGLDVVSKHGQRLVLQVLHLGGVLQTGCLWNNQFRKGRLAASSFKVTEHPRCRLCYKTFTGLYLPVCIYRAIFNIICSY